MNESWIDWQPGLDNSSAVVGDEAERPFEVVFQTLLVLCLCNALYLTIVTSLYAVRCRHSRGFVRVCNVVNGGGASLLFLNVALVAAHSLLFPGSACYGVYVSDIAIGTIDRALVYLALWTRQDAVNGKTSRALRKITVERRLSKVVLAGIVLSSAAQIIVLTATPYNPGWIVCDVTATSDTSPLIRLLAPLVFSTWIVFQLLLLLLTLLPLLRHIRAPPARPARHGRFRHVVMRLCACALVCVACDALFVLVVRACTDVTKRYFDFVPLCYSLNATINLYASLLSYVNYRQRLWPLHLDHRGQSTIKKRTDVSTTNDLL